MRLIDETDNQEFYLDYFEGEPIIIFKDKKTGQVFFLLDDVARALGYQDPEEMMSDDGILDGLNEIKEATGEFPIKSFEQLSEAQQNDFQDFGNFKFITE